MKQTILCNVDMKNTITWDLDDILNCCVHLDFLYQSFYDLLNQNYTTIRGKRFCRIAIGSDSYRYEVHPKFKAVVIAA